MKESKEEEDDESDNEMGFGLFDDEDSFEYSEESSSGEEEGEEVCELHLNLIRLIEGVLLTRHYMEGCGNSELTAGHFDIFSSCSPYTLYTVSLYRTFTRFIQQCSV